MLSGGSDGRVEAMITSLIQMDRIRIREMFEEACRNHCDYSFIDDVVVPALEGIGTRWEEGILAISQVYMSGVIIEEMFTNYMGKIPAPGDGRDLKIATVVLEDHHMLGERVVSASLHGAGYSPIRYGRRTVSELIDLVRQDQPDYLLISTLMLPSALKVKAVTTALKPGRTRFIVGGAPFRIDPALGAEVGADRVCATAVDAIAAIRSMEEES